MVLSLSDPMTRVGAVKESHRMVVDEGKLLFDSVVKLGLYDRQRCGPRALLDLAERVQPNIYGLCFSIVHNNLRMI